MLLIKKGQTNDISVSVSLNATLSSPTYLFKFVNILSKDTYIFYPKVILLNERYDEFQFIEGSPTNLSADPPVVSFKYEGQYWVYIYQMPCGSTSLNPDDGELIWDGRGQVIDDCPEPQYWEYISDNENNANFIFLQEDEICPVTPSMTMTPTMTASPTETPTQTPSQTASQTPSQTATQTPTESPSQTPTFTPTQTASQTATQTPSQTPTFTPTQTSSPTNTPTQTGSSTPTPTPSALPNFCIDSGFDYFTAGSLLSTGGTMYVFGALEFYDNNNINKIARINQTSALLDANFNPPFAFNTEGVFAAVEDSNGNLFLGGSFTSFDGAPINRLVKIDNKGNRIQAFYVGTGFNGNVNKLILDELNNELYVAGAFTTFTGQTNNRLIKLNATTGEKITTFNIGTGFNQPVFDITLDGSGGLYVGGSFTTYTGATNNRLIKLDKTTGGKDTTFNNTTGLNSQANQVEFYGGNLYVAGVFSTWKGATYQRFIKIDPTGTVDATYNTSNGFGGTTAGFRIDSSGRAVVATVFTTYSGQTIPRLVRLNTNATLDTTFATNIGSAFTLGYQSDNRGPQLVNIDGTGNIYIAGGFSSFDGKQLNNFVKLDPNGNNITFNNCSYPPITPTPSAQPIVTDPDAAAYVSALNSLGAVGLTDSVKTTINTLFLDLKNAGIYSKLYTLYPMVGEISAPMRLNAVNPADTDAAYRLSSGAAVTFSKKGVSGFSSTSNFLNTNFNPTTVGISSDSFALFSYTTVSGVTGTDIGAASLNAYFGLSSNASGNFRADIERNFLTIISATGATLGFQAVSRTNANDQLWVRDGGSVNTFASVSNGGIATVSFYVGAYNGVGDYCNRTIATVGMAQGLNETELSALRDIINTFETSYNR